MSHLALCGVPLLSLAIACGGNAVDLGHADAQGWADAPEQGPTGASGAQSSEVAPQTIYQSNERVLAFTIDETTLFAMITRGDSFELVSCPIEACRSQRSTLYTGPALVHQSSYSTTLFRVADSLIWRMDDDGSGSFQGVASCPVTGCHELTLVPARAQTLAADEEHVYWIDAQRYLMRLAPGAAEPEQVRDLDPELLAPQPRAAMGDELFLYTQRDGIYAVRKDGTAAPQQVVQDERIADLEGSGGNLYYSTSTLTGTIQRCVAADCSATRAAIANGQRWPLEVNVSHEEAFWLNQSPVVGGTNRATLASCALPDCANVRQWGIDFITNHIDPHGTPFSFALNRRYVVWVERYRDLGSGIRRVSR